MIKKMLHFLRTCVRNFFKSEQEAQSFETALSYNMENAISTWAAMYTGSGSRTANGVSLGLPAAISAEFARLATLEAQIKFTGERGAFLMKTMAPILQDLRRYTEYACALGGCVFKPYVANGNVLVDFVQADNFVPTAFNASGNMTGAVFCDQLLKDGGVYTRLEYHNLNGDVYTVENKAFYSSSGTDLGRPVNLTDVTAWRGIAPFAKFENVKFPLFAYLRVPGANNIDMQSPLGVSVFGRAVELINNANEQYARLLWEFEGGELAVDAAQDVLMGLLEDAPRMPKGKERLFRQLSSSDSDFYRVFSPQLRDESLINGLDLMLKRIEFNCSLAYGTLSDPQNTDKTAEEIRASKQRSYAAVRDMQTSIQNCLTQLADVICVYADMYKLTPSGKYKAGYKWDDSIVADEVTEREQMRQDCINGAAQWWEYRAKFYGEDEATARKKTPQKEVPQI